MAKILDIITYAGEVNFDGYERLCELLKTKTGNDVVLALSTPGGDPHAGFRIARALQHCYGGFDALVPRYCKSAGTLILIGARHLYLDDMSELGPLDIQVKKGDELFGRSSGLDIFQAMNYLQSQSLQGFRTYLVSLTKGAGLSTKVASEIASRLIGDLFEPIAAQIDPIKLAEMQRANDIAFEYGERLDQASNNLLAGGLAKLIAGYPSHGFVIDRKEARTIFARVDRPNEALGKLSAAIHDRIGKDTNSKFAVVDLIAVPIESNQEATHEEHVPDTEQAPAGAAPVAAEVGGAGAVAGGGPAAAEQEA